VAIVTFQKEWFWSTLRAIATGDHDISLPQDENLLLTAGQSPAFAGAAADPTKGQISFFVKSSDDSPAPDVALTISGTNGGSPQPIYMDTHGTPLSGATAGSQGAFVNVPEGLYVVRLGGDSIQCTASTGLYGYPMTAFPVSGQAALLVPVIGGFVTAPIGATCASAP
jgi:hypothetical protein